MVESGRSGIIAVLMLLMDRRGTSFWGWKESDWLGILGSSYKDFEDKYVTQECRNYLAAFAYIIRGLTEIHLLGRLTTNVLAERVFGKQAVAAAVAQAQVALRRIGYGESLGTKKVPAALCKVLLANWSPDLKHITVDVLLRVRDSAPFLSTKEAVVPLSRALRSLGIIDQDVDPRIGRRKADSVTTTNVPVDWACFAKRWRDTTTLEPKSYYGLYYNLMKVGRWIASNDVALANPEAWTYESASGYVAALVRSKIGDTTVRNRALAKVIGKPLSPRSIGQNLAALRAFFRDCQEWNWIERRFDPGRAFKMPKSIRAKIAPDPRVIDDAIWAKLLWAGLNLAASDLPKVPRRNLRAPEVPFYPLEMVKAITITWLFGALRNDELVRLRVGCTRWQQEDAVVDGTFEILPKGAVCWLDIPVNKTHAQYTKPTDRPVGEAITAWEKVRPVQPRQVDPKTGELVHYLFSYRGMRLGDDYVNHRLIPTLCAKAGIPKSDARGRLTSHRARATLASQLFNSKDPMSLFEIQQFLGHRSPSATQHYVRITPTKLAKKYADAGYFERNLRTIQVLIDRDAITSGAAGRGEPWQYYDLGHGWCTNSYFSQCVHRMACARCAFYVPKQSARSQMLEAQSNLQIMLQSIPLTDEEKAAVEEGTDLFKQLCERLADVPTPAGPTPRQLRKTS
jgi:integrase